MSMEDILLGFVIPLLFLGAGALGKKLVRKTWFQRSDFFLGIELALAAMSLSLVHILESAGPISEIFGQIRRGGDTALAVFMSAVHLIICFVCFLFLLTIHQEFEGSPTRDVTIPPENENSPTFNKRKQVFMLGIVSNSIGLSLMGVFVIFGKGVPQTAGAINPAVLPTTLAGLTSVGLLTTLLLAVALGTLGSPSMLFMQSDRDRPGPPGRWVKKFWRGQWRIPIVASLLGALVLAIFWASLPSSSRRAILSYVVTPASETKSVPIESSEELVHQAIRACPDLGAGSGSERAKRLFAQAASTNDPLARMWVAWSSYEGRCGFEKEQHSARAMADALFEQVNRLAGQANADAALVIGQIYADGVGLAKNVQESKKWVEKAARMNSTPAMFKIAEMLHTGRSLSLDDADAVNWYRNAARNEEEPIVGAMRALGNMYADEKYEGKHVEEATKWLRRADIEECYQQSDTEAVVPMSDTSPVVAYLWGPSDGRCTAHNAPRQGTVIATHMATLTRPINGFVSTYVCRAASSGKREILFSYPASGDDFAGIVRIPPRTLDVPYFHHDGYRELPALSAGTEVMLSMFSAQDDCSEKMFEYAASLHRDRNVALDDEEAIKWYERTAEYDNSVGLKARLFLGDMYASQTDNESLKTATAWYLSAAKAGNADGMFKYAEILHRRRGLVLRDTEAIQWYKRAAEHDNPIGLKARLLLGDMYASEKGDDNLKSAAAWYLRAAEGGDAEGMFKYAGTLQSSKELAVTDTNAIEWYKRSATRKKHAKVEAMRKLGDMYTRAKPREEYAKEAFNWYEQASNEGDNASTTGLGRAYENGWGVRRDLEAAFNSYAKGAKSEEPGAMHSLGTMYETGRGVSKNEELAQRWYLKAGRAGQADSMVSLGRLYWWGQGRMKKNRVEARKWYTRAAELKHPAAVEWLKNHPSTTTPVSVNWHRGRIEDSAIIETRTTQELCPSRVGSGLKSRRRLQAA